MRWVPPIQPDATESLGRIRNSSTDTEDALRREGQQEVETLGVLSSCTVAVLAPKIFPLHQSHTEIRIRPKSGVSVGATNTVNRNTQFVYCGQHIKIMDFLFM